MMARFQQIDEALFADPALWARTHLLSISFDPAYDTPEVLRSFGRAFVKDRGEGRFRHWELATGTAPQVRAVADFFGVYFSGENGRSTTPCAPRSSGRTAGSPRSTGTTSGPRRTR